MKKPTVTLIIGSSALYYAIIFLAGSLFNQEFQPPLYFLALPLLVLVLVLLSDLSFRSTGPAEFRRKNSPSRRFSRQVQELARQIEVAVDSSPAYFDEAIVARLRDIMAAKLALEMGMEENMIRKTLANPVLGPRILRDERLYRLLYSSPEAKGSARVAMLEETIDLMESWRP